MDPDTLQRAVRTAALASRATISAAAAGGAGATAGPDGARLAEPPVFQAASLGKTFAAWIALALVDEGRLALDAPLEPRVGGWRLPPSPHDERGVTLRRVLSHTAGLSLPDYPGFPPGRALPSLAASLAGDTNGGGALALVAPPGAGFAYSGGGYTLVQAAIEAIEGAPFAAVARRRILAPLGLEDSDFDPDSPLRARAATGHDAAGRALPFHRFEAVAAAGLLSTAPDLARGLARLVAEAPPAMLEPVADTGRADGLWARYGLGVEIEDLPDGRRLVGHHGMNRGFRALMAADPATGAAFAALANRDDAMPALEALVRAWARA